jgi:RNA polymerase sigma factor (sigma-70 family)
MRARSLKTLLRGLRRLTPSGAGLETPDGELLERFVRERDGDAFAELVGRHGTLVLGVCRRFLGDTPDADDAFQAAFLVLVRKAHTLGNHASLAGWLHGVARWTALAARRGLARRRFHETEAATMHPSTTTETTDDLREVLDEEIQRLPAKYRDAVILCYFEHKAPAEAARILACPKGTIDARLSRARELLRRRLSKRHVALSATALAGCLERSAEAATLSPALADQAVQAATSYLAGSTSISPQVLALVQGAIQAMRATRARLAAALLMVLGVLGLGAGWVALARSPDDQETPTQLAQAEEAPAKRPAEDQDLDPLPRGARTRFGTVRFRHSHPVVFAAFSHDGALLGSVDTATVFHLWDASTGKELHRFPMPGADHFLRNAWKDLNCVPFFAFSPDGKRIASCGRPDRVRLWEATTGKELEPPDVSRVTGDAPYKVWAAALSPDGKTAGSAEAQYDLLKRENVYAAKHDLSLEPFNFVRFSPDGRIVAYHRSTTSPKMSLQLREVATGKELGTIKDLNSFRSFAFSMDGRTLATWSHDRALRLWDTATAREKYPRPGHRRPVTSLAFSPDGKFLASCAGEVHGSVEITANCSLDHPIRIWEVATGKELHRLGQPDIIKDTYVGGLRFVPDSKTLLAAWNARNEVCAWDITTAAELPRDRARELQQQHWSKKEVPVSVDGKTAVRFHQNGRGNGHTTSVYLYDVATGKDIGDKPLLTVGLDDGILLAPDNSFLVSITGAQVTVWDLPKGEKRLQFPVSFFSGREFARTAVVHRDGKLLARFFNDTIYCYDLTHGKEVRTIRHAVGGITTIAFSPDGKSLASAHTDTTIMLWDVADLTR